MILIAKPKPILHGSLWVFRGGSWFNSERDCRPAYRCGLVPAYRDLYLGFRVLLRKRTP